MTLPIGATGLFFPNIDGVEMGGLCAMFAENYKDAAVVHFDNSRRFNNFAALVLYSTGIYLPGFDRWRGRTTTALVFYIL